MAGDDQREREAAGAARPAPPPPAPHAPPAVPQPLAEAQDALAALAALRTEAQARLRGLVREFDGIVAAAESANADDEHDPEGATIAFERQHAAALIEQVRERLAEIDAATRRLAEGRYGLCERCGDAIGAARLAARPMTATCVRCAARR